MLETVKVLAKDNDNKVMSEGNFISSSPIPSLVKLLLIKNLKNREIKIINNGNIILT